MISPSPIDRHNPTAELPNVRLDLANRRENVVLVREMLTGVADAIDLDGSDLDDIRIAVTEACNNVVLHAYDGEEGPLEVELRVAAAGALEIVVRDRGTGIARQARAADDVAFGIGLPVIRALVHSVALRDMAGGGTEVRMEFVTLEAALSRSPRRPSTRTHSSRIHRGMRSSSPPPRRRAPLRRRPR